MLLHYLVKIKTPKV